MVELTIENAIKYAVEKQYLEKEEDYSNLTDDEKEDIFDMYEFHMWTERKIPYPKMDTTTDQNGDKIYRTYYGYFDESYEDAAKRYIREAQIIDEDESAAIFESVDNDEIDPMEVFNEAGQIPTMDIDSDLIIAIREKCGPDPKFFAFRNIEDMKAFRKGICISMTEALFYGTTRCSNRELRELDRIMESKNPLDDSKTIWESMIEMWNYKNPDRSIFFIPKPAYAKDIRFGDVYMNDVPIYERHQKEQHGE